LRQNLEGRQRYRQTTEAVLSASRKQGILQHLALEMTKAGMLQFTLDDKPVKEGTYTQAKALLQAELSRVPKNAPTPEAFISKDEVGVRELLSDRQQEGLYEFAHRTFQEYLTAAELKRTGQIGCLLMPLRRVSKHWHGGAKPFAFMRLRLMPQPLLKRL
jgi:predicted NACHT family NTPase